MNIVFINEQILFTLLLDLTHKQRNNAHSDDYFSYIAVKTLTAFLNSAFTICFFPNSTLVLHF